MPRGHLRRAARPRILGRILPTGEYLAVFCAVCRESTLIVVLPGVPVRPHIEDVLAEHEELHRGAV